MQDIHLFDVFVRQYGTDAPILAATIDPSRPQDCDAADDEPEFQIPGGAFKDD